MEMTIREYAEKVAEKIENAEVCEIEKANGVVYTGVTIRIGNVGANVYLQDMYDRGIPAGVAAREVEKIADLHKARMEELGQIGSFFEDYDNIKDKLRIRLYNKRTNADVFRSAKAKGFDDLILVPYVELGKMDDGSNGAIKVKKEHLECWGVTKREVIDTAIKNSKDDVLSRDLFGMVKDMTGIDSLPDVDVPEEDAPLIISNKTGVCGAGAVIGMLKGLKKTYKKGFFVIPSSIHEVIVFPNNGEQDIDLLTQMVKAVNREAVKAEEVLSDKAYAFI